MCLDFRPHPFKHETFRVAAEVNIKTALAKRIVCDVQCIMCFEVRLFLLENDINPYLLFCCPKNECKGKYMKKI